MLPRRQVEKTYDGTAGFNFVTNPSWQLSVAVGADCAAFTTGKFKEFVSPATSMFPLPSIAMPLPVSALLPPRRVENKRPDPDEFNLVTKASDKDTKLVPA